VLRRLAGLLLLPLLTAVLLYLPDRRLQAFRGSLAGVRITDRRGQLLYRIPGEGGSFEERLAWQELPDAAVRIFVHLEDRRFFLHRGVDPLAVARAAAANLSAGGVVSGASTLTMQLARLIAPHSGGWGGKLGEALYALRLETHLSKQEILLLYLNSLPFGHNTRGVGAAAWRYFSRPLNELSREEILLLATLPKAPARLDPFASPEGLRALASRAASQISTLGLSPEGVERAADRLRLGGPRQQAPHFVRRVVAELEVIRQVPLRPWHLWRPRRWAELVEVRTTLDLAVQEAVEEALRSRLAAHRGGDAPARPGGPRPAVLRNAAALAVDNETGDVLAWVGSPGFPGGDERGAGDGREIDAVAVASSSGSTLKPLLYALALEHGYTAASLLPDLDLAFGAEQSYRPENFDRRSRGPVRLRTALASSLNVPAVYLLSQLGLAEFLRVCAEAGLELPEDAAARYGLGAAIGNAAVSLEQLTQAFSIFPNRGTLRPLRRITFLRDSAGRLLPQTPPPPRRVFGEQTAWLVADILSDEPARVSGFGRGARFDTGFPALFKSGTASGYTSLWCLGATPAHTVGVWAGNLDGRPAFGLTGSSVPADVAVRTLALLQEGRRSVPPPAPPGLEQRAICTVSGELAASGCPATRSEYFREASAPTRACPVHEGGLDLTELFAASLLAGEAGPRIVFPRDGSVFYREAGLAAGEQSIRGWIVARPGEAFRVSLNGAPVDGGGRSPAGGGDGLLLLPVQPGRYRLEAAGPSGADAVVYTVR
jgi:penicillin-binding protein 1C